MLLARSSLLFSSCSIVLLTIFLLLLHQERRRRVDSSFRQLQSDLFDGVTSGRKHPIEQLVSAGAAAHKELLAAEIFETAHAAGAYRARRGRHPPPGFGQWVQYALQNNASLIEPLYDQIYHDLEPFWSLEPSNIRSLSASWHQVISIRNGTTSLRAPHPERARWLALWRAALDEIAEHLPDVDMAFNDIDEPRVVVAWEDIAKAMQLSALTKHTSLKSLDVGAGYPSYPPLEATETHHGRPWHDKKPYWEYVRQACPPLSEARSADFNRSLMYLPPDFNTSVYPEHTFHGYVSNVTFSRSPCHHPELRYMHGALIAPSVQSTSTSLFPLFSGCKITGVNNDILVPAAAYFSDDSQFTDDLSPSPPWEAKSPDAFWRGAATGGASTSLTWPHFHRHRFVAMSNASELAAAADSFVPRFSSSDASASPWTQSFALPNATLYDLQGLVDRAGHRNLPAWAREHLDVSFTHLMCHPQSLAVFGDPGDCDYLAGHYDVAKAVPLAEAWRHRLLPDIDGQSFSGRFRAYMRHSGSLVLKASVFDDWCLARLTPWYDYVPVSPQLAGDYLATVGFFLAGGADDTSPVARRIASQGHDTSASRLRRPDMLAYLYRLVLEFARVGAEERQRLSYVDDLW